MLRLRYRLIVSVAIAFIVTSLACKKQGYSRFLTIKCNLQILPDTPLVKMSDTIRIIAWIPYNSYDYDSQTYLDVRDMQVRTWGGFGGFVAFDTTRPLGFENMGLPMINSYFNVRIVAGEFENLQRNFWIKNFEKQDTCFHFEMQLIPISQQIYTLRPQPLGRAFMNNGSWQVDIISEVVNKSLNWHLANEIRQGFSPNQDSYFFKIVP